jgi:N-carbamoyl-L-amino-acid hydrolase
MFTDARRHSITKVPGQVNFSIDLRSQESATLEYMIALARRLAVEIGERRGVRIELGQINVAPPAVMDSTLVDSLDAGCSALGLMAMRLASGAGHDAQEFAAAGVPTAMIFVRNDHGSHNPREAMDMNDFTDATRLLAWQLAR